MNTDINRIDHVTKDLMRSLAALQGDWVTIAMETHVSGPQTNQGPIHFGNQVNDAEQLLAERGTSDEVVEEIIARMRRLGSDYDFWQRQTGGLVYLVSAGDERIFRLPTVAREHLSVGDSPDISVLVPHVLEDTRFRVLALSADQARLFEGTINSFSAVEAEAVPASYDEAFGHKERQHQLQHTTHRDSQQYHGHGGDSRAVENAVTRYFRAVSDGLTRYLRDVPAAPLLLASVPANVAAFREISSIQDLLDDSVSGNHDDTPPHELHESAWPIVHASHALPVDQSADRLAAALGRGEALTDVADIQAAAQEGRVAELFVDPSAAVPSGAVEDAIRQVLLTGGDVHALPDGADLPAAIVRY